MDLGAPTPKTLSGARLLSHPSSGVRAAAVAVVLFLPFHTQIPYRRRHTPPPSGSSCCSCSRYTTTLHPSPYRAGASVR